MPKKRDIDYLLLPDSGKRLMGERKKRAKELLERRFVKEILILKGRNSEEDMLYLGKILKEGETIAIATFPLHFKEYESIIKKAQKEHKFPNNIHLENIPIKQPFSWFLYGILGLGEEKLKKGPIRYQTKEKKSFFISLRNKIKKFLLR